MSDSDRLMNLVVGSDQALERSPRRAGRRLPAPNRRPRHLFDDWARVAKCLRAARRIVLFLDFDGTLRPLQAHPGRVWLDETTRGVLRRLAHRLTIVVISGRRRADVRKRVGVAGVEYLGLHGWEGQTLGSKDAASWRLVRLARRQIEQRLQDLPGVLIENKGPIFAVHYGVAAHGVVRRAMARVQETLQSFEPGLRLMKGRRAWEILPRDFKGKGVAVEKLIRNLPCGTVSIYIGDDTSDEDAFAVLRDGLTVVVGRRLRTRARFYLCNPAEVSRALRRLEAAIA